MDLVMDIRVMGFCVRHSCHRLSLIVIRVVDDIYLRQCTL